ncbi:PASTA domain-containing protein [Micromonospora chersina]
MTTEPPTTPWPQQPPAHQPPPPFPAPAAPRRKLGTGAIVGIVIGAVVLGCCGLTGVAALVGGDDPASTSAKKAAPTAVAPVVPSLIPTTASAPTTTAPTVSVAPTTPAAPPKPTTVVMPNLVGMNAAVAQDKLEKLGLTNIQFGSQDENDTFVILAANWTVTKQSHKKGTRVALDDLVVLTCTKQR